MEPRRKTPKLVVWLLVTVAVTAGLAYQAIDSAHAQRATAEAVLRDYASFAAEQYAGRVSREIAFYGLYPTLTWMQSEDVGGRTALVPVDTFLETSAGNLRQSLELQEALFRLDLETGAINATPDPPLPHERIRAAVLPHSRDVYQDEWTHALLMPGRIAYAVHTDGVAGRIAYGTILDSAALASYFRVALERGPLLPTTLIGSAPSDSVIWASVLEPDGEVLIELTPPHPGAEYAPDATQPLDPQLGGLAVRVAIQPDVAEKLIIGGLPSSRLPLTIALVVLAMGLIVITGIQLQRERDLARLRTEFVSNVSHELRTPLAQIRMFAETLLLGRLRTNDEQTRALGIIDKEARRLSTLVDNVLQFSRVEQRTIAIAPEPLDLSVLIGEVADTFRPLAAASDVTMDLDLQPVVAMADAGAVKQIVLNLLDNAVKYGPAGQTVSIIAHRQGEWAEIAVDDEGPGIPSGERERIWKRFQRLPADRNAATTGAGIGLAVVRELAALHGGTAWAEAGNRGARFAVRLPLATGETAAAAPESIRAG